MVRGGARRAPRAFTAAGRGAGARRGGRSATGLGSRPYSRARCCTSAACIPRFRTCSARWCTREGDLEARRAARFPGPDPRAELHRVDPDQPRCGLHHHHDPRGGRGRRRGELPDRGRVRRSRPRADHGAFRRAAGCTCPGPALPRRRSRTRGGRRRRCRRRPRRPNAGRRGGGARAPDGAGPTRGRSRAAAGDPRSLPGQARGSCGAHRPCRPGDRVAETGRPQPQPERSDRVRRDDPAVRTAVRLWRLGGLGRPRGEVLTGRGDPARRDARPSS